MYVGVYIILSDFVVQSFVK